MTLMTEESTTPMTATFMRTDFPGRHPCDELASAVFHNFDCCGFCVPNATSFPEIEQQIDIHGKMSR